MTTPPTTDRPAWLVPALTQLPKLAGTPVRKIDGTDVDRQIVLETVRIRGEILHYCAPAADYLPADQWAVDLDTDAGFGAALRFAYRYLGASVGEELPDRRSDWYGIVARHLASDTTPDDRAVVAERVALVLEARAAGRLW